MLRNSLSNSTKLTNSNRQSTSSQVEVYLKEIENWKIRYQTLLDKGGFSDLKNTQHQQSVHIIEMERHIESLTEELRYYQELINKDSSNEKQNQKLIYDKTQLQSQVKILEERCTQLNADLNYTRQSSKTSNNLAEKQLQQEIQQLNQSLLNYRQQDLKAQNEIKMLEESLKQLQQEISQYQDQIRDINIQFLSVQNEISIRPTNTVFITGDDTQRVSELENQIQELRFQNEDIEEKMQRIIGNLTQKNLDLENQIIYLSSQKLEFESKMQFMTGSETQKQQELEKQIKFLKNQNQDLEVKLLHVTGNESQRVQELEIQIKQLKFQKKQLEEQLYQSKSLITLEEQIEIKDIKIKELLMRIEILQHENDLLQKQIDKSKKQTTIEQDQFITDFQNAKIFEQESRIEGLIEEITTLQRSISQLGTLKRQTSLVTQVVDNTRVDKLEKLNQVQRVEIEYLQGQKSKSELRLETMSKDIKNLTNILSSFQGNQFEEVTETTTTITQEILNKPIQSVSNHLQNFDSDVLDRNMHTKSLLIMDALSTNTQLKYKAKEQILTAQQIREDITKQMVQRQFTQQSTIKTQQQSEIDPVPLTNYSNVEASTKSNLRSSDYQQNNDLNKKRFAQFIQP